ncbi:MAG: FAD-containing oxidoreductase [Anaerolineae bacterium]|nr:FAD-containing oxidoreductase [Anaerolineae bacterium]
MMTQKYDAIIIGAGQAGGPFSTTLAQAGWKTALVEREHIGGTCVNEGCTPTKTMAASARVAYLARRAADYGVHTGPVTVDLAKVRQRKRNIVDRFRNGSQRHIERTDGVDLLFGEARFTGPKEVEVHLNSGERRRLAADKIFINTGAYSIRPAIEGLDSVPTLDSTSIMELGTLPEHLLVLGGGYIGLEFGQMFRRFGSQVTIVQRGPALLAREDSDVAEEVAKILREDGINVLLETNPLKVAQIVAGQIELTVKTPAGERILTGSHLLLATGRAPNTDRLNLEIAAVQVDKRGFIHVNERLETNVPGIYALGDVKGGPAFTHISYDDFRIIRTNLLHGGNATTRDRLIPYTVFIDPQLGRVGLTETEARVQGRAFCVAKLPMTHVARALEVDETRGFMKAIIDAETGQILGAAILGLEGGEVMAVLQMAMMGRVPYTLIRDGVFAHPTLTESLNNLFMALDNQERKTCYYPNR